ncbi:MAG: hypothetical protein PHO34_05970 [Candidatus Omnitrophica bacterium]|nr:hypothetical protein [Candidatus Omnitrophota bacterium]MDD5500828.1 hypothetical protein [Candidatus Omnitrophota bacterium]
MEITIPDNKKRIHPVLIFKQAWALCWKNMGRLGSIYFIFNFPVCLAYFIPINKLQNQNLWLLVFYLFVSVISFWGNIALLLGVNACLEKENSSIKQIICQVRVFFFRYVATVLITFLTLVLIILLGIISVNIVLKIFIPVNMALTAVLYLVVLAACSFCFVYFAIRWSLGSMVCVLESMRPIEALRHSLELISDYATPVIGTYSLVFILSILSIFMVIGAGNLSGVGPEQVGWMDAVLSFITNIVLAPLWTATAVILFKKLKEVSGNNVHAQ